MAIVELTDQSQIIYDDCPGIEITNLKVIGISIDGGFGETSAFGGNRSQTCGHPVGSIYRSIG